MIDNIVAVGRLYLDAAREATIALWRNPLLIIGTILSFAVFSFTSFVNCSLLFETSPKIWLELKELCFGR